MDFIICAIIALVTFGIGIFVGKIVERNRRSNRKIGGVIHVDDSDPDGPYFFLELEEEVDELIKSGYLLAKVKLEHYISQN